MEPPAALPRPKSTPKSPGRTEAAITTTPPVKRERRWSVVALCVILAVLCALGAAAAVNSASDRSRVLAIARDVPAGQAITAADLTEAEVSADAALSPVPATDRDSITGKRPAVDLRKGGLLTRSQLATGTGLGDDKQQVGVQIKKGQAPAGSLSPGDKVLAVTTPAQGDDAEDDAKNPAPPSTIDGVIVAVSRPDATGTVVVNMAVATTDGPTLASRAALGRVALVREPRSN